MPERAILREQFEQMLRTASAAVVEYDQLTESTADPLRRDRLIRLMRHKHRHVELAERLLEILDE